MKKLLFLIILFPLFLNAQNETPEKWRFNFGYQIEQVKAFDNGISYDLDHVNIEKHPAIGHTVHFGAAQYLSKKIGFQYGLNYARRNMTVITLHSIFSGFVGTPILFNRITIGEEFGSPVLVKVSQSSLEIGGSFFWEHKFGKLGISTITGLGLSSYLNMETTAIDISQFSSTFLEEIQVEGDPKPKGVAPFGKIQLGIFYDYSAFTRFFIRPVFRMDFIKTQSDLLDNQLWSFGGMFGVSLKI